VTVVKQVIYFETERVINLKEEICETKIYELRDNDFKEKQVENLSNGNL
jgi:hypothetical protein